MRTARTMRHEGDENNKDDDCQVNQGQGPDDDRPPLPPPLQQHPHPLLQATAHSVEMGTNGMVMMGLMGDEPERRMNDEGTMMKGQQ
jgi:hypothetical protein